MRQNTQGFYVSVAQPEAHLSIGQNRLPQYNGSYYLDNGQEFQIELINPLFERVLLKVWINDKCISNSGLIMSPDSHEYLERYVNDAKKFQFNTFMVDDTTATKQQRERNGRIRVEFYREKSLVYDISPYPWCGTPTGSPPQYEWTGSPLWTGDVHYLNHSGFGEINSEYRYTADEVSAYMTSNTPRSRSHKSIAPETETGRVAQGTQSNQTFVSGYGDFEQSAFSTVEFQILPKSQMAKSISEVREYCGECGYRIRKRSWKHCPQCGNRL